MRLGTVERVSRFHPPAFLGLVACLALLLGGAIPSARASVGPAAPAPQKPKTQQPKSKAPTAAPARGPTPAASPDAKPTTSPGAKPAASPGAEAKPAASPGAGAKPAASPGAGAKPAAPAPPAAGAVRTNVRESEIYGDRLDGLQAEVEALKDKIFRSKARLSLLKETVLRGVLAGSRVILALRNRMGSSFRLVKIVYILDGAQIYARSDEGGALDQEDELVMFDGNLPPGPHTATIELTYKGHGYGIFAYLSGYTFDSRSTHSFTAPENGAIKLTSVGFERGNMTTEMKDRPSVDWQDVPLDAAGRPLPTGRRGK